MARVLVVDDDPAVAGVLVEFLQADGHTVDSAANGAEALQWLHGRAYDAIVIDTRMPVMDGPTLYGELERRYPELRARVAFISGDIQRPDTRDFLGRTDAPALEKPVSLEEICRVVRRLVGK